MSIGLKLLALLTTLVVSATAYCDQTYILNSTYSPPHSTINQQGYLDLILKEAFKRAGFSANIRMLPAERCLQDSNNGISDGEIARIKTMSQYYPNLVLVDEPIIENRDFVAFSIHHEFKAENWSSLKPYNVAIIRGWKIFEKNITGTKSLISMESTLSMFELLKNDRADVVVNARIDGLYHLKKLGVENVKVMEPPLASVKLYLFMHKKNQLVIPKIKKALKSMKADNSFYEIKSNVLKRTLN